MRTVGLAESKAWLEASDLVLDDQGWLEWPYDSHPGLYAVTPKHPTTSLPEACRQALDWLPPGRERLLFVREWDSSSPDLHIVFEAIRRGAGASDSLANTPGHLFTSTKSVDTAYDDRIDIDVQEESLLMWLMGMMLDWTWEGYVAVQGCQDVLQLGDGFLQFLGAESSRMDAAGKLAESWGFHLRTTFPWGGAPAPIHTRR